MGNAKYFPYLTKYLLSTKIMHLKNIYHRSSNRRSNIPLSLQTRQNPTGQIKCMYGSFFLERLLQNTREFDKLARRKHILGKCNESETTFLYVPTNIKIVNRKWNNCSVNSTKCNYIVILKHVCYKRICISVCFRGKTQICISAIQESCIISIWQK